MRGFYHRGLDLDDDGDDHGAALGFLIEEALEGILDFAAEEVPVGNRSTLHGLDGGLNLSLGILDQIAGFFLVDKAPGDNFDFSGDF